MCDTFVAQVYRGRDCWRVEQTAILLTEAHGGAITVAWLARPLLAAPDRPRLD